MSVAINMRLNLDKFCSVTTAPRYIMFLDESSYPIHSDSEPVNSEIRNGNVKRFANVEDMIQSLKRPW